MRKTISALLLSCILVTSMSSVSYAKAEVKESNEIYLLNVKGQAYTHIKNLDKKIENENQKIIKVEAIDSEIFKSKADNKILMRSKNDTFIEVQEVKINPQDKKEVEEKIKKYKINKELADSLRRYVDKCDKKEISNPKEVTYYTPMLESNTNSLDGMVSLAAGTTYQGYGGKTYYEELLRYDQTSDAGEVKYGASGWDAYFNTAVTESISYAVGTVADKYTGGVWTIANIFKNILNANTYPSNSSFRHMAFLIETKYVKTTSVVEWNYSTNRYDYYVGASGETTNHYFGNYTVVPGYQPSSIAYTSSVYQNTPNYLNLDTLAYYNYLGTPYSAWFTGFKYQDKTFTSVH